jgi:poly-gamma-glutamate capsule biosynthesis protein CapA/YwtB (metallophosphatase superfamily)
VVEEEPQGQGQSSKDEGQSVNQAQNQETEAQIAASVEQHLKLGGKKPFWKSKKVLIPVVIVLSVLILSGCYILFFSNKAGAPESEQEEEAQTNQTIKEDPTTIRMYATGDFIAHDAINQEAKQENSTYSYSAMLEPMQKYFRDSDINFCNQATLAGGVKYGITGYPVFNAPFEWIHDMKSFGCNVINTGTNHTNDKGQGAITSQLDEWDKQNVLAVAGANRNTEEQNKVRYFEAKGVKFAFVSYTTYSNVPNPNPYSLNRFNDALVVPQMTEARANADIVIVSMRWGTEYSGTIDNAQEQQSQKLADMGADIVLGHGTHTLQPVKRLVGLEGSETIVWYSLGNFLNAQLETEGITGCVAQFNIDVATKKLTDSMCLPFYQHYEWTAEQKAAEDLLSRSNFLIMPLFNSAEYMAKSQIGTTVDEQMERITGIVNTFTKIPVQNAEDL